jgi:hypothetical protein
MASAVVTISVKDLEPVKMLLWELMALRDDMRVRANPEADRLERIIERFSKLKDDRA